MKSVLISFVIAIVALPVAGLLTFLLTPFWRWLESNMHVESIGHSGPATWCFVAIYIVTLLTALTAWLGLRSS